MACIWSGPKQARLPLRTDAGCRMHIDADGGLSAVQAENNSVYK